MLQSRPWSYSRFRGGTPSPSSDWGFRIAAAGRKGSFGQMKGAAAVLLDDARPGRERLLAFGRPLQVIAARDAAGLPAAFAQLEAWRAAGRHLAGYLSYELGYLLEPRLERLLPQERSVPLLWFGVFGDCTEYAGGDARRHLESRAQGR